MVASEQRSRLGDLRTEMLVLRELRFSEASELPCFSVAVLQEQASKRAWMHRCLADLSEEKQSH